MSHSAIVTLLFTDIVESTELLDRIGDDRFEELRREHFRLLRHVVQKHGGEEVKNLGDGLMVVFASAVDAVAASVAMQQAMLYDVGRREDAFRIRVGLNVAEPIRDESDYFGRSVVVARRLCDAAKGGQVLASSLVHDLVGGRAGYSFNGLPPLQLKGLSEPVRAYDVRWEAPSRPERTLPSALASSDEDAFVGRRPELAVLHRAWSDASNGKRQAVFIGGEPGIGKTRLAAEAAREAVAQEGLVLFGRCDAEIATSYQPFVEALNPLIGLNVSLPALRTVAGRELVRLFPALGPSEGMPARTEFDRPLLFEAITDLLATIARESPTYLVIDDLHWAAKPTMLLLRHVLRGPDDMRLLVVVTYRDTAQPRELSDLLAELRRHAGVERLSLGGLDSTDIEGYVRSHRGSALGDGASRELIESLHRRTDGNPFFLSALLGGGAIDATALPESVAEVIKQRIERLSDAAQRIVKIGSMIGPTFSVHIVDACSDLPADAVLDALDEALAAGILAESGVAGEYGFSHDLIRATVLRGTSSARRVQVHRRVAEALEQTGSDLDSLAYHFTQAAPGGDIAKAVDYSLDAARQALDRLAFEQAASTIEAALRMVKDHGATDPQRKAELLLTLGDAREKSSDLVGVREVALQAAQEARLAGSPEQLARAAMLLLTPGSVAAGSSDPVGVAVSEEALRALGHTRPDLRARLLSIFAYYYAASEGDPKAIALSQEAVEVSRMLGDAWPLSDALASHAVAIQASHDVARRAEVLAEAIRVATTARNLFRVVDCYGLQARLHLEVADVRGLTSDLAMLESLGNQYRSWIGLAYLAMYRAGRALLDGRFAEAEQLASGILQYAAQAPEFLNVYSAQMLALRREQGRLEEMRPLVLQAVEQFPTLQGFRAALAVVEIEGGRLDDARGHLDMLASTRFVDLPRDGLLTTTLSLSAEASAALDDEETAGILYPLLAPYSGMLVVMGATGVCLGSVDRSLGLLSTCLGRHDEARTHHERALQIEEQIGSPPLVARTQLWFARALRERAGSKDIDLMTGLLDRARRTATDLGMARLADDVDCEALRLAGAGG